MRVTAVKSFGGSMYGHHAEGSVFELPPDVDWLQAGLVVPFEGEIESAAVEATETAVKPKPKRKTTRRRSAAKKGA